MRTQKLVKNGWTYFHLTVLKFFLTIGTPKNSTDLISLGLQLSIVGLKSAVALREGPQLFAQSWKILKKNPPGQRAGL